MVLVGKLPILAFYMHILDYAKKTMEATDVDYTVNAQVGLIKIAFELELIRIETVCGA